MHCLDFADIMESHITVNLNDDHDSLSNDVSQWSTEEVKRWLRQNGYKEVEVYRHVFNFVSLRRIILAFQSLHSCS